MFRLLKYFRNFKGLSFSVPELLREDTYATDMSNVRLSENLSITKRRGYQISALTENAGSISYNNTNLASGVTVQERFVFTNDLIKLSPTNVSVIKQNPANTDDVQVSLSLDPVSKTFKFKIFIDGIFDEELDLGNGLETIPVVIDDLASWIGNGSRTVPLMLVGTSSSTLPAAFIESFQQKSIPSIVSKVYTPTIVSTAIGLSGGPFSAGWSSKNSSSFQNYSAIQAHNCLYVTNKQDGLMKYDGNKVYKAGLPQVLDLSISPFTPGSVATYTYIAVYEYVDAQGNITKSRASNEELVSLSMPINVGIPNTITIDTSNIFENGFDTEEYIGSTIPNRGMTVRVYRTSDKGTVFYEVYSEIIDETTDEIIFNDGIPDSGLVGLPEYIYPVRPPDLPPKCQYITLWKNLITLTGENTAGANDPDAGNRVWLADVEHIEGFNALNSFNVVSKFGQANSGIYGLDSFLYTFKPTAIAATLGDPVNPITMSTDFISEAGIGALSHHTIFEANNQLFFIARNGVYSLTSSGPEMISDALNPLFYRYTYSQTRGTGFYWPNERKIVFHLPIVSNNLNDVEQAKTIVYDLLTQSWQMWSALDLKGGINLENDNVWFAGSTDVSSFLFTNSQLDYADHDKPISLFYKTHWETLGEPSVEKQFLRIKVYKLDTAFQSFNAGGFTIKVETEHDFNENAPVSILTLNLNGNSGGWGNFPWGLAPWGEKSPSIKEGRLLDRKTRALRVVLRNDVIHENVLISGIELEVSTPYGSKIAL